LKDTSGPAINPLIKVMNLISILVAPLIIATKTFSTTYWIIVIPAFALVIFSLYRAQKAI
jgi:K(+)-stimulated pyrophosphate-energized sodium pump